MNNLFIVVQHPGKDQVSGNRYINAWQDGWKLWAISTKPSLIRLCSQIDKKSWIYIYRTRLDRKTPQAIVCRCKIEWVDTVLNKVYFTAHEQLLENPPINAMPGMLSFWHNSFSEPKIMDSENTVVRSNSANIFQIAGWKPKSA